MIEVVLIAAVFIIVGMWYYENQKRAANPDHNCLNDWFCPVRLSSWQKSEDMYTDRSQRQNDTLTQDGRMEHVSYPVPDPAKATVRDLFS